MLKSRPSKPFGTIVMLGPWEPAFLAFSRSCAARGFAVHLLDVGSQPHPWKRYSSCLAGGGRLAASKIGTPEGVAAVHDFVRSVEADVLIGYSDSEQFWLARNRSVFEPACKVMVPPVGSLELLASKRSQINLASRVGFDVLPTWYLWAPEDYRKIPQCHYPVALRPDQPTAVKPTFKVVLAQSPEDLRSFLQGIQSLERPVIAQPFRILPNLLVHGVRSEAGEILALQPFLVPRKFQTVTLSIRRADFPPGVEKCCRDFIEASGITGCFHYDLLLSPREDRAYYLEINARIGGTTDKVKRLGFDEPGLSLVAFGLPMQTGTSLAAPGGRTVVNKLKVLQHIEWALRGKLTELDYPAASRVGHVGRSLLDLLAAEDSVFDWRDLRGSLWYYWDRAVWWITPTVTDCFARRWRPVILSVRKGIGHAMRHTLVRLARRPGGHDSTWSSSRTWRGGDSGGSSRNSVWRCRAR